MPPSMRLTIARYMTLSKQTIPHYYLTRRADLTAAISRREAYNAGRDKAERVSLNDLVVKATAVALKRYPGFNGYYQENSFIPQEKVNLGVAVALDEGLIAPAILDCADLPLEEIARRSRDLSERARLGKLKAAEYSGATFTVSNLGMLGIEVFTAIIIPPQVGILAVGAVEEVYLPRDGQPVAVKRLALTLSADHRATDGADGARFLGEIVGALEDPDRTY